MAKIDIFSAYAEIKILITDHGLGENGWIVVGLADAAKNIIRCARYAEIKNRSCAAVSLWGFDWWRVAFGWCGIVVSECGT